MTLVVNLNSSKHEKNEILTEYFKPFGLILVYVHICQRGPLSNGSTCYIKYPNPYCTFIYWLKLSLIIGIFYINYCLTVIIAYEQEKFHLQ